MSFTSHIIRFVFVVIVRTFTSHVILLLDFWWSDEQEDGP